MHAYRTHNCAALSTPQVGETVRLSGWVHRKRDHGGVLFVDLRDHYGLTQVVVDVDSPALAVLDGLPSHWGLFRGTCCQPRCHEGHPGAGPLRVGLEDLPPPQLHDMERLMSRARSSCPGPDGLPTQAWARAPGGALHLMRATWFRAHNSSMQGSFQLPAESGRLRKTCRPTRN